jgi:hypothetical protein
MSRRSAPAFVRVEHHHAAEGRNNPDDRNTDAPSGRIDLADVRRKLGDGTLHVHERRPERGGAGAIGSAGRTTRPSGPDFAGVERPGAGSGAPIPFPPDVIRYASRPVPFPPTRIPCSRSALPFRRPFKRSPVVVIAFRVTLLRDQDARIAFATPRIP